MIYALLIKISFSPKDILVKGAEIVAIGLITLAPATLTNPSIFLPSVVKLTFELATLIDVLDGVFFKLTLSILKLTLGTILSNFPFIDAFIETVPL